MGKHTFHIVGRYVTWAVTANWELSAAGLRSCLSQVGERWGSVHTFPKDPPHRDVRSYVDAGSK